MAEKQIEPELLSVFQIFFALINFGLFYIRLMALFSVDRRQFFLYVPVWFEGEGDF